MLQSVFYKQSIRCAILTDASDKSFCVYKVRSQWPPVYATFNFVCYLRVFGLPADFKEGIVFSTYSTLVSSVQRGNKVMFPFIDFLLLQHFL